MIHTIKEVEPINRTESSKLDENRTGDGVLINNSHTSHNNISDEAIYLGNNATVFQAAFFQWEEQNLTLYSLKQKCCHKLQHDSQAAIMSLDNTKIKSKNTLVVVLAINKLR